MRNSCCWAHSSLSRLALLALMALSGCGGNSTTSAVDSEKPSMDEKSLFVVGALQIDPKDCIAKAESSASLLSRGVLDLAFRQSYSAFLLVGNQLARAGADATGETERVSLRSAEITLTTAGGAVLQKYSNVTVGFIDASTASAAYGVATLDVIPPDVGASASVQSAKLVIAKIRVLGEALNGTPMISSEAVFPITVCTGCLVQYPPEAADPTTPSGSSYLCTSSASATLAPAAPPCVIGQDVPFSCTLCAASLEICRDPSKNPAISQ